MNLPESELAGAAERLQTLVAQGRYSEAQTCFDEYCLKLKETIRRLLPGDPRLGALESQWRRVFDQTRHRVLAGRAHAAARLARLPQRPRLYSAMASPGPTWEVIG